MVPCASNMLHVQHSGISRTHVSGLHLASYRHHVDGLRFRSSLWQQHRVIWTLWSVLPAMRPQSSSTKMTQESSAGTRRNTWALEASEMCLGHPLPARLTRCAFSWTAYIHCIVVKSSLPSLAACALWLGSCCCCNACQHMCLQPAVLLMPHTSFSCKHGKAAAHLGRAIAPLL